MSFRDGIQIVVNWIVSLCFKQKILLTCFVTLILGGCGVTPRLDANFDGDPLGAPPTTPLPTPPADFLVWRTLAVSPNVVPDPVSGNRVRAVPLANFLSDPDLRRVLLIAGSAPFTTSPAANIRGHVRLRLDGPGTLGVGMRAQQSGQTLDFIGGFELSNFLPPSMGAINIVRSFNGTRLNDPFSLPAAGKVASYTAGTEIEVNWTIDQDNRIFSVTVLGQQPQSVSFPATSASGANTPIQVLVIYFWLQRPTAQTVVFVDKISAEEYR